MSTTDHERHNIARTTFWALPHEQKLDYYAYLRDHEPVSWHDTGDGEGLWAVALYEDVREVSRNAARFCSSQGVANFDVEMFGKLPEGVTDPVSAAIGAQSFLAMDDPEHKRLRGLVQKAFSPRQMAFLEEQIAADAKAIVDGLEPHETGDFVERVSKRLPLITISKILGVPEEERERMLGMVDAAVSFSDPEFLAGRNPFDVLTESFMAIAGYAFEKAQYLREHGGEGVMAALVEVEEDGQRLTDAEIAQFTLLLAVAGNDTTRNTTSSAMRALTLFPEQRAILQEDLDDRVPVAVDEFVRWASPVTNFLRTATEDCALSGQEIAQGDKVMMLYESANRDPRAFDDPDTFDVTRTPNRHAGFGGGGPHFCLGAVLARTQLRALFTELLRQFPDLTVDEPKVLVSTLMNAPVAMAMDTGRRA